MQWYNKIIRVKNTKKNNPTKVGPFGKELAHNHNVVSLNSAHVMRTLSVSDL